MAQNEQIAGKLEELIKIFPGLDEKRQDTALGILRTLFFAQSATDVGTGQKGEKKETK